jgi:hypothetical protein
MVTAVACATAFVALITGDTPPTAWSPFGGRLVIVGAAQGHHLSSARAEAATVAWCGTGETPDDRLPQSDALATSTIRVFYAYPSDSPDRFGELADAIVSDIAAADTWWRAQDSTRSPRWDLYAFPGCSGGVASLDLGVIPLSHPAAYYAAKSGFERLLGEVVPHLGPMEKALVYFDGYVIADGICGVSLQAARNGGAYGLSMISLRSGCWIDLGSGGSTARVATHELGHNLGAVPSKAPNRCGDASLGGHVCDSPSDLMFPFASQGLRLADAILDVGRDDYYGHSGTWWDVQDSVWLVHLPYRALSVLLSGPGAVSSAPAAIDCPEHCSATLESDLAITLTAHPADGAEFYGWSRGCSGGKECSLTMTRDVAALATFGPPRPVLRVRVRGQGRVTSSPAGVRCPGSCEVRFGNGTRVRLAAHPASGWQLAKWSGALGAKASCSLVLAGDRAVTATFLRVRGD